MVRVELPRRDARGGESFILSAGDLVLVRFGAGEQVAQVLNPDPAPGLCHVRKWRDNSRCWTKPTTIPVSYVVGVPSANDHRARRALAADVPACPKCAGRKAAGTKPEACIECRRKAGKQVDNAGR